MHCRTRGVRVDEECELLSIPAEVVLKFICAPRRVKRQGSAVREPVGLSADKLGTMERGHLMDG